MKILAPLLVVATVGVVLTGGALSAHNAGVSVTLRAQHASHVSGSATVKPAGAGTKVSLSVRGLKPRAVFQALVRAGTCARPRTTVAVVRGLKANGSGRAANAWTAKRTAYARVADGKHVLTVAIGSSTKACGRVPAAPKAPPLQPVAGKGTGGSTAACSPDPCTAGAPRMKTIRANDGSGYVIPFDYSVTRPNGLTKAPDNRAPLLINFRGVTDTYWASFAAANKFVVINVPQPPNCPFVPGGAPISGGDNGTCAGYNIRAISPNAANVRPLNNCGPPASGQAYGTGSGPCDLKYEIKAILDAEIPAQNIDPNKIFASGSSRGGTATEDLACDPMTSHYFRGVFAISAAIFAGKKVKAPQVANVNNSPMLCPALTTPPINDDISIKYIHGTNDHVVPGGSHLVRWADGTTSWYYSQTEGVTNYWSKVLGCADHTTTKFGTPNAINVRDTFTSCTRQYRGVELDEITGGNHGCPAKPGLDGFNGSDCRVEAWTFLSSH